MGKLKKIYNILNEKFSEPEKVLKGILPNNYINKNIFRIAIGVMLLVALFGAYKLDFDFKNYYTVSCKATEPMPCMNPFYYCLHKEELSIKDYTNPYAPIELYISSCDGLNLKEVCSQGVCDNKWIEIGQTIGKQKPDISWISWLSLGILLVAFMINHAVWMVKKNGS
jgi:hypothetical protein